MSEFILNWRELLQYRKYAYILSVIVIIIGLGGVVWRGGLLYGIDFTGGFQFMFEFSRPVSSSELAQVRNTVQERLAGTRISTFDVAGEAESQGLMLNVRGAELVETLTGQLAAATSSDDFEAITEEILVDREILAENFRFGEGPPEKLNLEQASRSDIRSRVQRIVNETISDQIVSLLRQMFGPDEAQLDLNWAREGDIQQWLIESQAKGFLTEFENLRDAGELADLPDLLQQFEIPKEVFETIFTTDPAAEPGLIDLNEVEIEALEEIIYDEFFHGRYGSDAERILEIRNSLGLFTEMSEVLEEAELDGFHEESLLELAGLSPFVLLSSDMVSPAVGADLITLALLAILISFGGVLAYLYVRFELTYSLAAIAAIVHDVVLTVGLLTLLGVEFDVPVVAAVLTVIGYSLNDTIVNFDRIRENKVLMGYKANWYEVINRSIYEVLNRTLVTSITTFIAVLILFLYGGIALRAFSITLLIGIIAGTYSSIFISNASLLRLQLSLRDI